MRFRPDHPYVVRRHPCNHYIHPNRPRGRSGQTALRDASSPRHPPTEARGLRSERGRRPDRPFPLPWHPRTAGEQFRGPRTSGARSPECNRKVPEHFAWPPLQLCADAWDACAARSGKLRGALAVTENRAAPSGVPYVKGRGCPRKKRGYPQMSQISGSGKGLTNNN